MSEIKTVDERLSGIDFSGNRVEVSTEEFAALNDEVSELRAAYEALQKDLAQAKEESQNYENSCRIVQAWNGQMTLANGELRVANAAQAKRIAELEEDLQFVERWASHHGTKPNVTAQEALSCIQHYPSIAAITKSYKDGVIPTTRNPYAELAAQAKRIAELEEELVEWNEFKKIRDAQMQALRKQMP